jgi:tetraacyldisaccharide 4'-kinase
MNKSPAPAAAAALAKPSLLSRARIEAWLNQQWYEQATPALALRALVPVYRLARWLSAKGKVTETCDLPPIVIVGNLTVGGSGKTPVVLWLLERALAAGFRPGVISRGYGGSFADRHQALQVNAASDWRVAGDEPVLIAKRTGVPVAVCADRLVAARALSNTCNLLICDDGLQNSALPRRCAVLVIDGVRRFGNQRLLPAGPLREDLNIASLAQRFPLRVCNGGEALAGEFAMALSGRIAINSMSGEQRDLAAFSNVRALAGIGNPERFYAMLRGFQLSVEPCAVGDHGRLSDSNWRTMTEMNSRPMLPSKPMLTTEKDILKYPANANVWWVPVRAEIPDTLWQEVLKTL